MSELNRFVRAGQIEHYEVFLPPSTEARFLVRHLGWLVAPRTGRGSWLTSALGAIVVAPFTQFTFFSYELQAFLFEVFHRSWVARVGHFVFMLGVNFFAMAAMAQFTLGAHPSAHATVLLGANGATLYAAVLLVWYALAAVANRMWGWWLATAPVVLGLAVGANVYYSHTFTLDAAQRTPLAPTDLAHNPWLWMIASAFMIAFSHLPESLLPPRLNGTLRWMRHADFVNGTADAKLSFSQRVARVGWLLTCPLWGALDEWWASPRLLPYNVLMLMFRAGYRPDEYRRLKDHVARAVASGNPALDFVGIGGGAHLQDAEPH